MNKLIPPLAAAALLTGGAVAGCQSHGSPQAHAAASSAKAQASALATSPAVLRDETAAASKITSCAAAQGVTVTFSGTGKNLRASVAHVKLSFIRHPFRGLGYIAQCAGATTADAHNVKVCSENVASANGLGHGTLGKDLVGVANCVGRQEAAGQ